MIRDWENLTISLGSDGKAFWARDGKTIIWGDLPPDLNTTVSNLLKNGEFTDCPRLITFGVEDNYFMLTTKNMCHWKLGHYPDLDAAIPLWAENSALHTIEVNTSSGFSCVSILADVFC